MLTQTAGETIERVAKAAALDELRDILDGYLAGRGINMFTAALIAPGPDGDRNVAWVHNADPDYFAFYLAEGETADYGIRRHAEDGISRPYKIGAAYTEQLVDLRPEEKTFYDASVGFGHKSGLALPNWTPTPLGTLPTGFSIWAPEDGAEFDAMMGAHGAEIALVLFAAQAQLLEPLLQKALGHDALTERERECLRYAAAGYRADRIGEKLTLATLTVHVHLRSARKKLGAMTNVEAVAKAVRSGIVQP